MIKTNGKEWWIIAIGVLAAGVKGMIFPSFSLFFGQILTVFQLPSDEVLGAVHMWAALFVALGVVSGISNMVKVVVYSVMPCSLSVLGVPYHCESGWYFRLADGCKKTRLKWVGHYSQVWCHLFVLWFMKLCCVWSSPL